MSDETPGVPDLREFTDRWQATLMAMLPAIVAELQRDVPRYAQIGHEQIASDARGQVLFYSAYLGDPDQAKPTLAARMAGVLGAGIDYSDMLDTISIYRRYAIRAAAQVAPDAPHAGVGVERLMRVLDIAAKEVVGYHVRRITDAQARLERSFAASPLSAIEFDTRGAVTSWNASAERIFGWSAAEAIGQNVIQLLVPPMGLEHVNAVVGALLDGQFANSRNMNATKDGGLIMCQWHNAQLRNERDEVVGVLSQTEDITAQVEREQRIQLFYALAENAPYAVALFASSGHISYINPALRQMIGDVPAQQIGELLDADTASALTRLQHGATWSGQIALRQQQGATIVGQLTAFTISDSEQHELAIGAIIRDITDQLRAEAAQQELQTRVIDAQRAALRELSTPLIPIAPGVVAMPLIGTIDADRASQVLETLLTGVSAMQAEIVILDITGVPLVDTYVADGLMRAARAVGLLGGTIILTGIRPEVAQTLVGMGIDLSGITTRSTLQSGIAHALQLRQTAQKPSDAARST